MRIVCSLITGTIILIIGCAPPYNPYKIDKKDFASKIHTVGIMPVSIDSHAKVINTDEKERKFELLIESMLRNAGFQVVPCSQYRSVYQPIKENIGPLYDANTGEPIQTKREMLLDYSKREYLSKNKVDALVWPDVISTKAYWASIKASWDGAQELVVMGKDGLLERIMTSNFTGSLPALSLRITIAEPNGQPLFVNSGGIQLLAWLTLSGRYQDVPRENLLANLQRNQKSVELACKPLMKLREEPLD